MCFLLKATPATAVAATVAVCCLRLLLLLLLLLPLLVPNHLPLPSWLSVTE
jgi:hypothetical protein